MSMGRLPSPEQEAWAREAEAAWDGSFSYVPTEFKLEWMQDGMDCFERSREYVEECTSECGAELLHSNQFCYGALDVRIPKIVVGHSDVLSWWAACRGGAPEASTWSKGYEATVRRGLSGADAVVAPTRWMAEQLQTHYGVSGEVRVIANGRQAPSGAGSAQREDARAMQAITCGRLWDEGKNLRVLAEVDAGMPVLVAGEIAFESEGELPASVESLGPLSEGELQRQFERCSLYLLTSQYEPFGLAAVEAALAGCAVVANDIPSLREVWGDAAMYFERNSAASLTASLRELAGDEGRVQRMARAARERAWERYSAERMTEGYLELYGELLAGRRFRNVA